MKKNTAGQKIGAQMVSASDGSAFTGSVTVYVCGDAGTQAAGSVGSGACTHEGNGYHTYAPAQAETNYDLIAFTFTGTGAVPATVQVETQVATDVAAILDDTGSSGVLVAAAGLTATSIATGAITAASIATGALTASKVADDLLARLGIVTYGTMQAGSTSTTAVLASATSFANDLVNGSVLTVTGGTGVGQSRVIVDWDNASDTATVDSWTTTPDGTSTYAVFAAAPASTTSVPAVNVTQISGSAVSTSTAQLGVNVVQAGGTAWSSGAITAASIAADAITDAKVASDVTIASVTGAVGSVTGNVGGNVVGSVGSVAAGGITAASIATDAIDADAIASDAVDEILDRAVEGSITLRQAIRVMLAALAGKVSGAGTTTITIRDANDTTNRIVATVDASGNRSAITLTTT